MDNKKKREQEKAQKASTVEVRLKSLQAFSSICRFPGVTANVAPCGAGQVPQSVDAKSAKSARSGAEPLEPPEISPPKMKTMQAAAAGSRTTASAG